MKRKGIIFDIQRFGIHDGRGIRTVIFFKGCPLKCPWCQNPESKSFKREIAYSVNRCIKCEKCVRVCPINSIQRKNSILIDRTICNACGICVDNCPSGALEMVGKEMSVEDVMLQIIKDKMFYEESGGGITLSGGEPTLQPEFAISLLKACRENGIHTAVETCGECSESILEEMIKYTDLFLYDLKHIDEGKHKEFCGTDNKRILSNLEFLIRTKADVCIRIPLIPGFNIEERGIKEMVHYIKSLSQKFSVHLLPFNRLGSSKAEKIGVRYPYSKVPPLGRKKLLSIKKIFEDSGVEAKLLF